MRAKKYQHGGKPSNRDAMPRYSSMEEYMSLSPYERGGSGAVESTFGPLDYIAGAFPIARVLSPAAKAVGKYFGLGNKATKPKLTYDQFGRVTNPEIVAAQKKATEKNLRLLQVWFSKCPWHKYFYFIYRLIIYPALPNKYHQSGAGISQLPYSFLV